MTSRTASATPAGKARGPGRNGRSLANTVAALGVMPLAAAPLALLPYGYITLLLAGPFLALLTLVLALSWRLAAGPRHPFRGRVRVGVACSAVTLILASLGWALLLAFWKDP